MTETDNVATYARIRPYNPAINEDKRLTARAQDGNKILNSNGDKTDTYNFTRVYDMKHGTMDLFETGMKPLLEYKILQGINSIFIVYGQSGSGKSFTLIGEKGHLGVLPLSLQYLLEQDCVERIDVSSIEAYGIKATKIGFYDLVTQLETKKKAPKKYDPYTTKDNSRLNAGNASILEITRDNCLQIITELQEVSHMAPTLKNPHSSRGHTVYFCRIKMTGLEDVYFIAVDLAGSEGATALGTKDEFVNGLKLAMSKGKLKLNKKQMKGIEQMYKTRFFEAACINNGLTQLQSIFGELIKRKISKSQGIGLRKVLSSFINLRTAYAILFTLSASANNNKTTRATLNFAKQTQLVKVDTQKAKAKIDKDAIIKELNELIEKLRGEMKEKNKSIEDLKKQLKTGNNDNSEISNVTENDIKEIENINQQQMEVFEKFDELTRAISEHEAEEAKWTISVDEVGGDNMGNMNENKMRNVFNSFDEDGGGTIDAKELQNALKTIGQELTMDEVEELIEEIDVNGDGEVDFDEFKVMVSKNWFVDAFQSKLVKSVDRMMTQMNILSDDYNDDDDEYDDKEDDNKQVDVELQQKEEIIQDLIKEKNDMEKKQMDEIKKLQMEMEELRKQSMVPLVDESVVIELRKENGELKNRINGMNSEKESLMNEMKGKMEMIGNLQNEIENLNNVREENNNYKNNMNTLQNENNQLKNSLNIIDNLNNENNEMRSNLNTSQSEQMKQLKNQIKKLEKLNKNNSNVINELKSDNEKLRDDMIILEGENDELKKEKSNYVISSNVSNTDENEDIIIDGDVNAGTCGCFVSFFNKFKNNNKDTPTTSSIRKPLATRSPNDKWDTRKISDDMGYDDNL